MPFAPSGGRSPVRIHYAVHGDRGPAVVLLHGLGLSSRFWFDVPALLAGDPERPRRVVTIDNRGTGRSGMPRRPWSMRAMAEDVVRVLDHAGIDAAFVVGISMGGMIAQHLALRHPSRVRGLVLLATTAGFLLGALPDASALARLLTLPLGGPRAGVNLVRLLLPESRWAEGRELFREWPRAMREEPTTAATFAAHFLAASTHLVAPRLGRIRCPVVVVAGRHDTLVPLRNAEVLAARIPSAELEVLEDEGHAVFAGDPDLVRRLVHRLERTTAAHHA